LNIDPVAERISHVERQVLFIYSGTQSPRVEKIAEFDHTFPIPYWISRLSTIHGHTSSVRDWPNPELFAAGHALPERQINELPFENFL